MHFLSQFHQHFTIKIIKSLSWMRTYSTEARLILSKHSFTCKFSLRSYTVITSVKSFFFPKLQLYCRILIKVKQPNKNTASSSTTALDFSFQPWGLISYESSTTTLYDSGTDGWRQKGFQARGDSQQTISPLSAHTALSYRWTLTTMDAPG